MPQPTLKHCFFIIAFWVRVSSFEFLLRVARRLGCLTLNLNSMSYYDSNETRTRNILFLQLVISAELFVSRVSGEPVHVSLEDVCFKRRTGMPHQTSGPYDLSEGAALEP